MAVVEASQPHRKRPRRRPGENRERLLEAGIREFSRLGYQGAGTASIAALAEVPQPHVYASFATKAELFLACVERGCAMAVDDPDEISEVTARLLLQAFAAAQLDELAPDLTEMLGLLAETLGERILAAALGRAAIAQLASFALPSSVPPSGSE